jgi:hypothetical protein
MSIFSKWATAAPDATVRFDELESGANAKVAQDARKESASLAQFLKERKLLAVDDTEAVESVRGRVEKSGLVRMMNETCASINTMAGRTIVDAHLFLPPEPMLCCFIYVEDGTEYFMRLELQGTIPTLVFAERRWRDTVTSDLVRWAHRLVDIEPVTVNVKLVHEFQEIRVAAQQVREWFMYLVSGMDRSRTPSFG